MSVTVVPAVHPIYRDREVQVRETPIPGAYSNSAGPFCFPGAIVTAAGDGRFYYYDPELLIEGRHFIYAPDLGRHPTDKRNDRYWVEIVPTPHR